MTQDADDVLEGLSDEQLSNLATRLEVKRSNAAIGALLPSRGEYRDVQEASTEELAFELLEMLPGYDEILAGQDWAWFREQAERLYERRNFRLDRADDDSRISNPVDFYLVSLLRKLLGRSHDKVADPTRIFERYRGRFPDRVLRAAYYAAIPYEAQSLYAGRGKEPRMAGYSPAVRAKLEQLAGGAV